MNGYQIKDQEICLTIKVKPNARQSAILGLKEGVLHIAIHALPVDGAANKAVIELLAKVFRLSKSSITIKQGQTARIKVVCLPYSENFAVFISNFKIAE